MSFDDMVEFERTLGQLEPKENKCRGLVFRGHSSQYVYKGVIGYRQSINLLKRKSCIGCSKCGWMFDEAHEFARNKSIIFPGIDEGRLYTVKVTNISRDWESGYVDDYDLEIVPLPREEQDRKEWQ